MRPGIALISLAAGTLFATAGLADTNYASVEAKAGQPTQLTYHATAHKNCTSAAAPTIKVTQPPKNGTLIVRKATFTTDKVAGCPKMTMPANIVHYQGNDDYAGPDHVAYEATPEEGATIGYDLTITVVPAPEAKAPEPPADAQKGVSK